jgi:tetratricopeptide (TPR) repeat protein
MALSEIEKLERRYAENPQGLTFAPLAEVHRKNGDVTRALELLRLGLTLHPDYIPASIVLGRCHLDLGDLPAAEAAFSHVLSLDGENVIALKALGDIAERLYRFDDAERWLKTLLAIDRSNDEARDQLGRVEASRRQAETGSSAAQGAGGPSSAADAPAPETERSTAELAALDDRPAAAATSANRREEGSELDILPDSQAGHAAPAVSLPPLPEPPKEVVLAWVEEPPAVAAEEVPGLELEELDLDTGEAAPPPEGIELEEPVSLEEPVEPLSGLVGRDDGRTSVRGDDPSGGWQVETAEDIVLQSAGGSEFQVANASEELLSAAAPQREPDPLLPERPTVEKDRVPEASAAPTSPVAEAAVDHPDASKEPEPPPHPEPDLVITESMAGLLLEQGHVAEALTVYRHLERRTGDARFQEKIADLERAATRPPSAPIPDRAAAASAAASPAGSAGQSQSYSVQETKGQSVQSFLRGLLSGRVPAASAGTLAPNEVPGSVTESAGAGAPTRPAHDSLSLSSVFGDESTPTPPAVPSPGQAGAAPAGVSYDEFFGAGGSGPARTPRAADAKSDDLDQFHTWLQNLKR